MSKIMRCEFDKDANCNFREKFEGDGPGDVDCLLCLASSYKHITKLLCDIIAAEGAGRYSKEFISLVIEAWRTHLLENEILKKVAPDRYEVIKEKRSGATLIAPYGLPKNVRDAILESNLPQEVKEAVLEYERKGRLGRV